MIVVFHEMRLGVTALVKSFTNIILHSPSSTGPLIEDEVFLDRGIWEYLEALNFPM